MLNPIHLRTLQVVVETESFADAARLLHYTPSAVSQQMALLESTAGLVLFEREARGIRPTVAALMLVDRSRELISGLCALEEELKDLASGRTGRISLGCVPSETARLLPRALRDFSSQYPNVEVLLEEAPSVELEERLFSGALDTVIVAVHDLVAQKTSDDLVYFEIMVETMHLLVAKDRPDGKDASMGLAAFADDIWVSPRAGTGGALHLEKLCAEAGFKPKVHFRSANLALMRRLIMNGLAVGLLPSAGPLDEEHLSSFRLDGPGATRRVVALHRTSTTNPLLADILKSLRRAADDAIGLDDELLSH